MSKKKYTVEIKVNNGSSNALNKIIEHGSSATATITPDYGYVLSGATVTGEGCSLSDGTLTISNVTSNGVCEVTLERDTYTVTLSGVGLNTSNSPQTTKYEGSATLNYTLKDGYYMGESSVNCDYGTPVVNGNTITVSNVTANTTCTITPTLSSYNVTLKVNGGTVNNKAEDTISVQHGSSGTFSIAASTGYKLELNGSISCEGASGTLSGSTVTISGVTKVQTCTVNLKKQTYTVTVSVTGGSASPSNMSIEYQGSGTSTITASSGYLLSSATVSGEGCSLSSDKKILTASNVTSNRTCTVTIIRGTLADTIKEAYPSQGERTDFSSIVKTVGMYTATDDQGTSYYLTGNPNNWVSFAGKLWRIIRVNGNGSVRLLYAGTGGEDGYIGSAQAYNTNIDDSMYVGWKYGTTGSLANNRTNENASDAYTTVKNWYDGLSTTDKVYIDKTAIYCNDRTVGRGTYTSTGSTFYYAAYTRLATNKEPVLTCTKSSDRFKDGFGLMTADEVALAGGVYNKDNPYAYFYKNVSGGSSTGTYYWWTMTPSWWHGISKFAVVLIVYGSCSTPGHFLSDSTGASYVVRPVISLKSTVLVTGGSGTGSDPYVVSLP